VTATQVLVVVLASFAGALVKGVTGLGYPVIAVPLISIALGVEEAVVVVALPNFAANSWLWWESRDARGETRDLDLLVGFGVIGAIVGTLALERLPEEPLLLLLAGTVGVFVVRILRHPDLRLSTTTARRWSPVVGSVVGVLQGAIGVSGPVVATWIAGYRLAPRAYVHAVTFIFGVTGLTQIVVLAGQGAFTVDRVPGVAWAALAVVVATPIGVRLRARLVGPAFERVVLGFLAFSAVLLVVDAVT
jgi:uncharacterized membrane protein YfcA